MQKKTIGRIPVAKFPEQVGVSSEEIRSFVDDLEENNVEYHSIIALRNGKIAYEGYRYPFGKDVPHAMYSVSKSFVSVAIGFAIDEGLLTLDTKVIDIFPAYRPKKHDEYLEKMTVYHLLTMTAGKDVSVFSDKTSYYWVKDFFDSKWYAEPGKKWKYISENTYMCVAILQKLTGMGLREYLQPRLFEPLGFNRMPQSEVDREGLEAGGWGLFITPEEFAKFILCLQQNGVYEGKQVIPAWYVEKATSYHVPCNQGIDADACAGYGMFFWMSTVENAPRADGMFSQFGVMFKDYDASLIFTGSEIAEQKVRDCIFRHFPKAFTEVSNDPPEDINLELKPMPVQSSMSRSVLEKFIDGKTIKFAKNAILNAAGFPLSVLPFAAVYMSADKAGNIDNVVFNFSEEECVFSWNEGPTRNSIHCGMNGELKKDTFRLMGIDFTAYSYAIWTYDGCLELYIRPVETVNERILRFEFKGNKVTLYPDTLPSSGKMLSGFTEGLGKMLPKPIAKSIFNVAGKAGFILDQPLFGTLNYR